MNKQPKTRKEVIEIVKPILKKYKVSRAGFFGSYANSGADKTSDLDLLIETPDYMSLLDFSALKLELEDKLGLEVDLVDYDTIKPLIKNEILEQERKIIC